MFPGIKVKKIVIGGGSGLLGSALTAEALNRGYRVVHLTRKGRPTFDSQVDVALWDPVAGDLDPTVLAGAAAVVCFNGAGILNRPWTSGYKRLLRSSRIGSVKTIVAAMRSLSDAERPQVFVSGSATGFYGPDSRDKILTEESTQGSGFLADLCDRWEAEALGAAELTRVVLARTGLAMSTRGGMLRPLKWLYKLRLGAQLGDGLSWMPSITAQDHARAVLFCIDNSDMDGPVNLVGPHPVRNRDWHRALEKQMGVTSPFIVPAAFIRLALGEAGREAVLASARVVPTKLVAADFQFHADTIDEIFQQTL